MTATSSAAGVPRPAWNRGKITGPKPPLRPSHVWAIRAKLDLEKRARDLAMSNLAIGSKLRGCNLVALRVDVLGSQAPQWPFRQAAGDELSRFHCASPILAFKQRSLLAS